MSLKYSLLDRIHFSKKISFSNDSLGKTSAKPKSELNQTRRKQEQNGRGVVVEAGFVRSGVPSTRITPGSISSHRTQATNHHISSEYIQFSCQTRFLSRCEDLTVLTGIPLLAHINHRNGLVLVVSLAIYLAVEMYISLI